MCLLYISYNSLICIKVNNNFLFHIVLCPHYITKVIGLTSKVLSWLIEIIWPSGVKYQSFSPVYWVLYSEPNKFLIRWCASCSMVLPLMAIIFRRHMGMAEINMDSYTQAGIKLQSLLNIISQQHNSVNNYTQKRHE